MMKTFSREELRTLAEPQGNWCVSLFMPTHRSAAETHQDQIRLRNLLREAEDQLIVSGVRASAARDLLEPAQKLAADQLLWRQPALGLALFINESSLRHYQLPLAPAERVVVAHQFHLKPLLALLHGDERFFVLALSQNQARLWQGMRDGIHEVSLGSTPSSLAEAMKFEDVEKENQLHSVASPGGGGPVAVFHGHAEWIDQNKDRILRYFHQVDDGVHKILHDEKAPLVLAGVEYLLPIYREVNTYPYLMERGIAGNPEEKTTAALHAAAWALVQPQRLQAQQDALAIYRRFADTGRASHELAKIVQAAYYGRVGWLFVAIGVERWGVYDVDGDIVHVHPAAEPGDEELLDFAATQTLLSGGTVFALDADKMPSATPLVAVFRY